MNPKSQDQLCEDVVLHVLRMKLGSDFILLSYDAKAANVAGIMGQYSFLTTKSQLRGIIREDSFFVKSYPVIELSLIYAKGACMFEKERFIYELVKNTPAAPECYYSGCGMIVMENLEIEGYKTLDRIIESVDVIKVVITSLVKFHAASIVAQEKHPNFLEGFENKYKDLYYNKLLKSSQDLIKSVVKGLSTAVDRLRLDKSMKDAIAKHVPKIYELTPPSRKYRNVIVHGDLWPANLLVKFVDGKPEACKIIDFQLIRVSPPAQDLMSLLFLLTTREFRRRHENDMIRFYYSSLADCLERSGGCINNFVREDEFLSSCEEQRGFGVIQAAGYFTLIMLSTEAKAKLLADPVLSAKAFACDRSLMFPFAEGDEVYFKRVEESILDIVDYFGL